MTPAAIEKHCLSLPGATVSVQWGDDRVFKVGGKMFAVLGEGRISFKAGDIAFEMLIEQDGIIPAPYLARAKWVLLETLKALPAAELKARLADAHRQVVAKLPKKLRASLAI